MSENTPLQWHGTTILSVRKGNRVVVAGDGPGLSYDTLLADASTTPLAPVDADVLCGLHYSSGTTGQMPSRIFLDKATLHRQRRALISIRRASSSWRCSPFV